MAKYIVEFIGTFFLVFTVGMCVLDPGAGHMAPVAIGLVLAVMIFSGGHVSGGHYNPAVTTAVTVRGKSPFSALPGYFISQVAAGAVASFAVLWFKGNPASAPLAVDLPKALAAEFIFTFALTNTVLNVATAKGTAGNSFYGLAIGATVLAGAYAVGSVSGGAFNPAVAAGLLVMGKLGVGTVLAYVGTQLVAGIAAGALFRALNPGDT